MITSMSRRAVSHRIRCAYDTAIQKDVSSVMILGASSMTGTKSQRGVRLPEELDQHIGWVKTGWAVVVASESWMSAKKERRTARSCC